MFLVAISVFCGPQWVLWPSLCLLWPSLCFVALSVFLVALVVFLETFLFTWPRVVYLARPNVWQHNSVSCSLIRSLVVSLGLFYPVHFRLSSFDFLTGMFGLSFSLLQLFLIWESFWSLNTSFGVHGAFLGLIWFHFVSAFSLCLFWPSLRPSMDHLVSCGFARNCTTCQLSCHGLFGHLCFFCGLDLFLVKLINLPFDLLVLIALL